MVKKLFGRDKKKNKKEDQQQQPQAVSPPKEEPNIEQLVLELQQIQKIGDDINQIQETIEKLQEMLETIKPQIKVLLIAKKREEAKNRIRLVTYLEMQIDKLETYKNKMLDKIKVDDSNLLWDEVDYELQRFEKELEQEQAQKVANDFNNIPIVNQIEEDQQKNVMTKKNIENLDKEFKKFEQHFNKEKAQKVAHDFNSIPIVNVQPQQQQDQQQLQQQVQQPMKMQQQSAFEDQIKPLLN